MHCVLLVGHCSGTARALFGHCPGTVRALFGHSSGTVRSMPPPASVQLLEPYPFHNLSLLPELSMVFQCPACVNMEFADWTISILRHVHICDLSRPREYLLEDVDFSWENPSVVDHTTVDGQNLAQVLPMPYPSAARSTLPMPTPV